MFGDPIFLELECLECRGIRRLGGQPTGWYDLLSSLTQAEVKVNVKKIKNFQRNFKNKKIHEKYKEGLFKMFNQMTSVYKLRCYQ